MTYEQVEIERMKLEREKMELELKSRVSEWRFRCLDLAHRNACDNDVLLKQAKAIWAFVASENPV